VVAIWQRFGPYHLARLRGAQEVLASSGWRVAGIEVAGSDQYAWIRADDSGLARHTLFPASDYSCLSTDAIAQAVSRELSSLRPDAVCVNGWAVPEAVAALRWCRQNEARTILMSETFESTLNPLKRTVRRWRVAQVDAAIVGGRLHAEYLEDLGVDPAVMQIGYDVVDNAHFGTPVGALPSWADTVPKKRSFFANTRFLERKGIDALLKAFARYRQLSTGEAWHLVISGSGALEREWKELAVRLGLERCVHWPGFLQYDELPRAYQYAGAFVHASRREPWGLVVNEAAAAGLPLLVGRRVGAACELLHDGDNGFLVDPDNQESFARRLLEMATISDVERRRMGERSRFLVSAFGPDRFGRALRKCLDLDV
jgi:glycosyltransferase involved in cell wall biosynthesis